MRKLRVFLGVALAVAILADFSYVSAQKRTKQPKVKCEDTFAKADTDNDGKLSPEEFKAVNHPNLSKPDDVFKSRDKDKDGFLTKDEFCSQNAKRARVPRKK